MTAERVPRIYCPTCQGSCWLPEGVECPTCSLPDTATDAGGVASLAVAGTPPGQHLRDYLDGNTSMDDVRARLADSAMYLRFDAGNLRRLGLLAEADLREREAVVCGLIAVVIADRMKADERARILPIRRGPRLYEPERPARMGRVLMWLWRVWAGEPRRR